MTDIVKKCGKYMGLIMMAAEGRLYLCGTPIGNLEDITLRAINVLRTVDIIAAEDTRRTAGLLNHYEIETPLTSYHEHNEREKASRLIKRLEKGEMVALVSDAGMPGISDPGSEIINLAIKRDIEVTPVPGPTALISALVVSGFEIDSFVFFGFIPRKGRERKEFIATLRQEKRTVVFYESPHRLRKTLAEFASLFPDRKIAVIRELTKVHEEKVRGPVSEVLTEIDSRDIRGEITCVLAGREEIAEEKAGWEDLNLRQHVELLMENGYTKKKAIKKVAKLRDLPKREVYKEAIAIDARVTEK